LIATPDFKEESKPNARAQAEDFAPYRKVDDLDWTYSWSVKPVADHLGVVLIPVVLPRRFWHRRLHKHRDLVLSAALHRRPHVVVARLPMP
jgi:hypothetical protein